VHVGFPRNDQPALQRLVTLVANFERAIYATTGTKRRERSTWCRSVAQHGGAEQADRMASSVRYHVLNLTNLKSGRAEAVEFRAFAGTLNAGKILAHVKSCIGLVERAMKAKRTTSWTATRPVATSPIARDGEGQTEVTRLMYQLGWTKGRTNHEYGQIDGEGLPTAAKSKKVLMKLAAKYDAQA
jgi:hypothetical protein